MEEGNHNGGGPGVQETKDQPEAQPDGPVSGAGSAAQEPPTPEGPVSSAPQTEAAAEPEPASVGA